jgi:hypothetical protein
MQAEDCRIDLDAEKTTVLAPVANSIRQGHHTLPSTFDHIIHLTLKVRQSIAFLDRVL